MRMETRGERCFRGGVAVSVLLRTNTNEGRQPGSDSRRADGSRTPRASRGCGSSPPSAPAQPAAPQSAGGGGRPGACPAASQRSRRFKRSRASRPLRPLLPPAGGGAAGEKARAGREAPIGSRPRGWRSGAARAGPSSSPLSAREVGARYQRPSPSRSIGCRPRPSPPRSGPFAAARRRSLFLIGYRARRSRPSLRPHR